MTKKEIGEAIYAIVENSLMNEGYSISANKLPQGYKFSRAFLYRVRQGKFSLQKVIGLPGLTDELKIALLSAN